MLSIITLFFWSPVEPVYPFHNGCVMFIISLAIYHAYFHTNQFKKRKRNALTLLRKEKGFGHSEMTKPKPKSNISSSKAELEFVQWDSHRQHFRCSYIRDNDGRLPHNGI